MALVPKVPEVLAEMAALLVRNADPTVPAADRANALGLGAAVLGLAAEVVDGAAHQLVLDNRATRAVLGKGAQVFDGAPLGARLAELARGTDEDFRISALQAANDTLRRALIELHVAVEQAEGPQARALETAIWEELVACSDRRKLMGSPV